MILPDAPVHERARLWWDGCLAGTEGVGLARAALLAFIRITTSRRIMARPLGVADVLSRIESSLSRKSTSRTRQSDTSPGCAKCSNGWAQREI